jgi:hypothetical protein
MEPNMASLLFTCPTTRLQAPTGIGRDVQSLRTAWSKKLKVHCSLCGKVHDVSVRESTECADDQEAIQAAQKAANGPDIELWERGRLIARFHER